MGRKTGLTDEKLSAVLGDDLAPFNDTERLVIELADALTETPSNVSDELYARLRNQFSEEQLMQLGAHRVRKLSRTLESNFQRRERQSLSRRDGVLWRAVAWPKAASRLGRMPGSQGAPSTFSAKGESIT